MSEAGGADPVRGLIGYLLYKLGVLVEAELEAAVRDLGIRGRHLRVLGLVRGASLSQSDLCGLTGMDRTTMVGVADDLERLGYARRVKDPKDRRKQMITLTELGGSALSSAMERLGTTEVDYLLPLDSRERGQLYDLLDRVLRARDPRS